MGKEPVRPCTPLESLKQSLIEMKLIRNGQLPKRNCDDFIKELEKDDNETEPDNK